MQSERTHPAPPTPDTAWIAVDGVMRRYAHSPHALIETLHVAQEVFGYLDKVTLGYVAAGLRVPLSRAYGVATFYHLFRTAPPGRQTCVVCTGTACWLKGAAAILAAVETTLGIGEGETTADGEVSLFSAHCVGQCGSAPLVLLDDEALATTTAQAVAARIAARRTAHAGGTAPR